MTPALFHLLYVSNFIKRRFGSLFGPNFGLHRIPIWSLFHPNLGPYLYAHRSLSVYQHLPTAQHLIFIHLSINSTIHSYIHPSICLSFHPSTHPSNHLAPTHLFNSRFHRCSQWNLGTLQYHCWPRLQSHFQW